MIVPDAIEPIVGYKWLGLYGDTLFSYDSTMWPKEKPLVAECKCDHGYSYQPRPYWAVQPGPPKPKKKHQQAGLLTNSTGTVITTVGNWAPSADTWIKKPKIVLPHPYAWSWEQNDPGHEAPDEDCTCGIYMVYHPKHCQGYGDNYGQKVLVKLAAWGKTVVGSDGARAQYAYPQEIISGNKQVSHEDIQRARDSYSLNPKPEPEPELLHPQPAIGEKRKKRLW